MKPCSKKKILYTVVFFTLIFVSYIASPIYSVGQDRNGRVFQPANSEISQKKEKAHRLIKQRELEGVNVSEAISFLEQSRIAMKNGDKEECLRLLDKAITMLEKGEFAGRKQAEPANIKQRDEIAVELPVASEKVDVTELVPNLTSGKDAEKLTSAFKSYQLNVKNGKASLNVGSVPLLVTEIVSKQKDRTDCKDSPFGILYDKFDDRLVDLGVCWVRPYALVWALAEPEKGKFDWSRTDAVLNEFNRNNLDLVVTVKSFNHWDQGRERGGGNRLVKDINAYKAFLQKAVKRYPFVKAWQIENEPNYQRSWADTPENYLSLLKISYHAIKQANPDALVIMGGISDPDALHEGFWPGVFQQLGRWKENRRYFDVFDAHWFLHQGKATENIELLTRYIQNIRKKLNEAGYKDTPIWITEMASYSGSPAIRSRAKTRVKNRPQISEEQHAGDLVNQYVHALSLGVSKIFWVRLIEWSGFNVKNGYFDNTGLVNNPLNDGESHKKLAYYSYKKLAETLKGVNLKTIEVLNLGKQLHAYKLSKNGHPVYFIWAD